MINLCLDTNVYLSFYHFSDNDLQKLEEILTLIKEWDLKIILPEQIKNEFIRNREVKIGDALKKIKDIKIDSSLPRILDAYPEKQELKELSKGYNDKKKELIAKAEKDINDHSLKADILIQRIFDQAKFIPLSDGIREKAKKRYDLWNPPWKDKSYWDAIVRETLLQYDSKIDIEFVSIDWDYKCALDANKLNNFLQIERENKKKWKISFFSTLNLFFETYFPWIRINEEYVKNKYIEAFVHSQSFDSVRYNLRKIMNFENYSLDQINRIIDWSISNWQISGCVFYSPWVSEELSKLLEPYRNDIEFPKMMDFLAIYNTQEYADIYDSYMENQIPPIDEYPDQS